MSDVMEGVESGIVVPDVFQEGEGSVSTEEKFTVELPDINDQEAVTKFKQLLASHTDQRGVKTLSLHFDKYLKHLDITGRLWKLCKTNVNTVNGIRTRNQQKGDETKSLRNSAQKFYESLGTTALRQHCTLFGLNYDDYESLEDIIAALVSKNMEMSNGASHS